ncbi:MAG: adhesin [Clostridia bacterium]|nr:adhesin [Clostridia bacterium]
MNRKKMKRKTKATKAAAIVMTVMLTAFTLMMSGCSTGTASDDSDNSASNSAVTWEYVSPSDLKGDTAKETAKADSDAAKNGQDENASAEKQEGEAPSGQPPADGQTPPEKPDGDMQAQGEAPSGEAPSGQPPEMPNGEAPSGEAPSGEAPTGQPPSGAPGGGPDTANYDYSGDVTGKLTADGKEVTSDGETIESTTADENVLLAQNGGVLKVTGADITKSGDDSNGDNCNFYGINSSVLSTGEGSEVYLSDSKISSTGEGNNGVFATDSGTAYLNKVEITTKDGGNSRGLDATYGGVIYGNELTISTAKDHCAALATDRGGGYISVTNSSLETAGSGSPLIYSTGDIEIDNVTGTSTGSQIAGIEGYNRIVINNSTLESTNDATSGSDPIKDGVILYQSMSGDADTASSQSCEFEAVDSTLKTAISDGAMFYVTNTTANIILQNTTLDFDSDNVQLLNAAGNSSNGWGTEGKNGGNATLTAIDQTMSGNVYTDKISSASMNLTDGSTWTGVSEGENNLTVTIDGTSTWVVTDDTTITDLSAADGAKIVDADGKTVTIVADGKTVVEGDSDITVTVSGSYSTEVEIAEDAGLDTKVLDRTAFDEYYKTSTQFGTNQ